jgi:hypothetical protein
VFATDIQSLRDIFSFAAASYLSLRVQLHQFESAFKFAHLLTYDKSAMENISDTMCKALSRGGVE